MTDEVTHTDARELAQFEALAVDAKLREIWLNGRETNGKVAEVWARQQRIIPVVERHEFWFKVMGVAVGILTIALPVAVIVSGR